MYNIAVHNILMWVFYETDICFRGYHILQIHDIILL